MSGTDDLKNLLDKLKDEVGPLPPEPQRDAQRPRAAEFQRPVPARVVNGPARFQRSYGKEPERPVRVPPGLANMSWAENKEAMLFGMLAALVAALGGIMAGLDYLVLIGAIVFMLFSFMMLLSLFGSYLNSRRAAESSGPLAERIEALSRRVETLSSKAVFSGGGVHEPANGAHERELERKVEELRVLVKSLSRAVEGRDR
jgi:hypothetical protein